MLDGNNLTNLVNDIDGSCYATNTTASMTSRVKKFYAFLTRHRLWVADWNGGNLRVPTVSHLHLTFFIGFLCQTLSPRGFMMTTYGSVCAYLSSVRSWCRANNRPDPAIDLDTNLPNIRYLRFCKATKRRLGGKALTRQPLSPENLRLMLRLARLGTIAHGPVILDFVAALLLAFFALLRVSEYTTPSKDSWFDIEFMTSPKLLGLLGLVAMQLLSLHCGCRFESSSSTFFEPQLPRWRHPSLMCLQREGGLRRRQGRRAE